MNAVAELAGIVPEGSEGSYAAACCLARCLPFVEQEEQLSANLRQQWVERYADRALALLREASEKGFKDVELLRKEPDLGSLRSHAGFQQFATQLELAQRSS